ncbi:MAG: MXAN_5187 C-terminal domain-containing protein [Sandaracinaceae bacterium]
MRAKMIGGNLVVVLLVGVVSYFVVNSQLEARFLEQVDSRIAGDVQLFDQLWRLEGRELAEQAVEQAGEEDTADVFAGLDEASQRSRAYDRATQILDWLSRRNRNRGGPAEIVVITDDRGVVVARSQDRNRMFGTALGAQLTTLPGVISSGEPAIDVWRLEEGQTKFLLTAIAPIRDSSGIRGALVIGYDMSNGMASRLAGMLGREVVFVQDDAIGGASVASGARESLRASLFGEQQAATTAALGDEGTASEAFLTHLGDDEYIGVIAPVSYAPSAHVAYVVLGNRSAARGKAAPTRTILIMTGLGILAVFIYGFLLANSFIKPIEAMEEGVLAVINGRSDLRLDIESAELGGLAYRINQLLNVFTGTPEEDADGRVSSPPQAWESAEGLNTRPEGPAATPTAAAAAAPDAEADDPELAAKLANEPEEEYYARIFKEYVAAKEAAGENVANITEDRFIQRLKANEKSLIAKHGCRMVRFQVQTRGTQVNLRPVVIR